MPSIHSQLRYIAAVLSALHLATKQKRLARTSERTDAPFACPHCKEEVILRKGRIIAHHFAHRPPVTCARGLGESQAHLEAKLAIFDALRASPVVRDVEIEHDLGDNVADVFAFIHDVPVAIELQRSTLSVREISARTQRYAAKKIATLWVGFASSIDINASETNPAAWLKWAHAAYFGRVYLWHEGQTLQCVHFDAHHTYVPATRWREGFLMKQGGDYYKRSKRARTPVRGPLLTLDKDFAPTVRDAWQGGSIRIPRCVLWMDTREPWWNQRLESREIE